MPMVFGTWWSKKPVVDISMTCLCNEFDVRIRAWKNGDHIIEWKPKEKVGT